MKILTDQDIQNIRNNTSSLKEMLFKKARNNPYSIDWISLTWTYSLPEDFIREFQDKVDWFYISYYQILSENFIREFQHKVCWLNISIKQILSEDFIIEFKDKLNWNYVSYYQTLSDNFIRNNISKLNKDSLLKNPNVSNNIKQLISLLS